MRLGNVPFFHAKLTYGDVLVVEYDPTYKKLTWDSGGLPYERILERIVDDGGRYAVVLDFNVVPPATDARTAFKPGRAYLAVPYDIAPAQVIGNHPPI